MSRALILLLAAALPAWAQQVEFEVSPREIGVNENVAFSIVVQNDSSGKNPGYPDGLNFDPHFELVQSYPSTTQSIQIINGRQTSSKTYTFTLRPKRQGNLTVKSQRVQFAGKVYLSPEIQVVVGPARQRSIQRNTSPFDPFDSLRNRRSQNAGQAEVIVESVTDNNSYYVGQPIDLEINLLRTPGLFIDNSGSSMEPPSFEGFWVEDLEVAGSGRNVNRQGQRFEMFPIERKRLYAGKPGSVTIEPIEFVLNVSTGGFFKRWQKINRLTDPLQLDIKPLPAEGQPPNFSGAVGRFDLTAELDKQTLKVGESLSLKIDLRGEGNFSAIREFPLDSLKTNFEIFDAGAPVLEKNQAGAVIGKTWVYALVPKRDGQFQLPPLELHHFDYNSESYTVARQEGLRVEVLPGESLPGQIAGGPVRSTLEAAQNLNFIKLNPLPLQKLSAGPLPDPMSLVWVLVAGLGLNGILFGVIFARNSLTRSRGLNRPGAALKQFEKSLKKLKGKQDKLQPNQYFGALSDAVHAYFGDKWERPGQGISLDMIREEFNRKGVQDALADQVTEVIEACDLARFTPSSQASREAILDKALKTIRNVEVALS